MHEQYAKSADVHSYAVLLHELLTHQLPFLGRSSLRAALAVWPCRTRTRALTRAPRPSPTPEPEPQPTP